MIGKNKIDLPFEPWILIVFQKTWRQKAKVKYRMKYRVNIIICNSDSTRILCPKSNCQFFIFSSLQVFFSFSFSLLHFSNFFNVHGHLFFCKFNLAGNGSVVENSLFFPPIFFEGFPNCQSFKINSDIIWVDLDFSDLLFLYEEFINHCVGGVTEPVFQSFFLFIHEKQDILTSVGQTIQLKSFDLYSGGSFSLFPSEHKK